MGIRAQKRLKAAHEKGRLSADLFKIDNEVRVHDIQSKIWDRVWKIISKREADDGQDVSFVLEKENGCEAIHHQTHLRHNVMRYTPITDTKVRFSLPNEEEEGDKEKKKDS